MSSARDHLYSSQISASRLAWRLNDVLRADLMLDECEPARRGWEWRHLRDRAQPEIFRDDSPDLQYVTAVAFSPDGSRLASARYNPFVGGAEVAAKQKSVRVSALAGRGETLSFSAMATPCRIGFSPDGELLAASNYSTGATVWRLADGHVVHHWPASGTIAFSPDGMMIASADDKAVTLRDGKTGVILRKLPVGGGRATFRGDGQALAVSGLDAVVVVDVADGRQLARLAHGAGENEARLVRQFPAEGPALAFHPDGSRIAVATDPPRIWEIASGRIEQTLIGHEGLALDIAFSPDGRRVATAGADTTVRLWDAESGIQLGILRGHAEWASSVTFHPDGWAVATGGRHSGDVKVWDLTRELEHRSLPRAQAQTMVFDSQRRLHYLDGNGQLQTYEPESNLRKLGPFVDLTMEWLTPARTADFSADGTRLATVSRDRTVVRVWDVTTGQELQALRGLPSPAMFVACSPTGRRAAAIGMKNISLDPEGRNLRVWDTATADVLATLRVSRFPIRYNHGAVAFSPDESRVAFDDYSTAPDGSVKTWIRTWDLPGGKEGIRVPFAGYVIAIRFSDDGTLMAASEIKGGLAIWDAATGTPIVGLTRQEKPIYQLSFSPDGRRLAGVSRDRARVWDVKEGRELVELRIDAPAVGRRLQSQHCLGSRLAASGQLELGLEHHVLGRTASSRRARRALQPGARPHPRLAPRPARVGGERPPEICGRVSSDADPQTGAPGRGHGDPARSGAPEARRLIARPKPISPAGSRAASPTTAEPGTLTHGRCW